MTETETPIIPMLYSAIGNNAYYLDNCVVVEHRPAYAACLAKVTEFKIRKAGQTTSASCYAAMRNGKCTALEMRQEEELAGKALFYVDRNTINREDLLEISATKTIRPTPKAQSTYVSASPKPAPKVSAIDALASGGGDYAAAINMAMHTAAVQPPPTPVVALVPNVAKAGMSMVEIALAALARKAS